jgi:hypothetical protein
MKRKILFVAIMLAASAATLDTANARGISALSGRARFAPDNCFSVNNASGLLSNGCGGSNEWMVSLDTDNNGAKTINVGIFTTGGSPSTSCRAITRRRDNLAGQATGFSFPAVLGFSQVVLSIPAPGVQSQYLLFVDCNVSPGDGLSQIDWNN